MPTFTSKGTEAQEVLLVDQTADVVILNLVDIQASTTLASAVSADSYEIEVADPTGFSVGDQVRIIEVAQGYYHVAQILGLTGSIATMDTPLVRSYGAGSSCTCSNKNINVDGSVTPMSYKLRTGAPSISNPIEITRIMFQCITTDTVTLNEFGNIPALEKGIVIRYTDANGPKNLFNVKTNGELAAISYDLSVFSSGFFGTGTGGFASRITFAGQNKMGVVLRIPQDGNLEALVQDDLTGISSLQIIAEGHVCEIC